MDQVHPQTTQLQTDKKEKFIDIIVEEFKLSGVVYY